MPDTAPYGAYAPHGMTARILATTRAASDSWLKKRLAFLLRRIAVRALRGNPVDIETFGARMRLFPYNNLCERRVLFTPQFFDPQERDILGRAVLGERLRDDFVFIDVGANIGAYSLFVAAQGRPATRVLSVEPQPEIFDRLVCNIQLNPGMSIKAVDCAVADRPGELTLFLDPGNSGQSSVKIVGSGLAKPIRVPATTLQELIEAENYTHVDALKLDVEGAADIILEPFFRDVAPALYPRLLIVEDAADRWQIDLPDLLDKQGYRLIARTRLNRVYELDA